MGSKEVTRHVTYTRIIEAESTPSRDFKMGRHVEHDSRSRKFPVKTETQRCPWWPAPLPTPVPPKPVPTDTVLWEPSIPALDQGELGSCVGNAIAHLVATTAKNHAPDDSITEGDAVDYYALATTYDDIPGQYPPTDTGSSGLGGMKALQADGLLKGYNHAFNVDGMIVGLQKTPVAIGVSWTDNMFYPNDEGFVFPTGPVVGGHEFMVYGWDEDGQFFTARNSWGSSWGDNGDFRIAIDDMVTLLSDDGDVQVPVWLK